MPTLRATLYARYSTDKQRESSIADQLRAARDRAQREGWPIVAMHSDEGVSGSTPVALRPGGKALLADALACRFDVLIVEGLDRLSRELGEQEALVKRLEHRSVRIIGTADGYDSEARGRKVMRITRGLVNELYLDDLREKTHRGLAGQFDRGFSAGGRSYGYRSVQDGTGRRLVINEDEAAIVREVYERYGAGESARAIAHRLNARGVPSARGGTWAVSAMVGAVAKGLGMLSNELYAGRVVWNRRQWLKDPETGKRHHVDRPRSEWQVREAPELRIVDAATWQRVRDRHIPQSTSAVRRGPPQRTLFGGLLRCATCGGAMVAINAERYGCSVRKDRGPAVCASGLTVKRDSLDRRLLAELRDDLLQPSALAELHAAVHVLLASREREAGADDATARRRLQALTAEIERLVDAVASMGQSAAIGARLRAAEAERDAIERDLVRVQPPTRAVIDDVTARYYRQLMQLQQVLNEEGERARTRAILADMIGLVTVGRDETSGEVYVEIEEPAERLLIAAVGGSSLILVAGAGFEPATFGL